MHGGVEFRGIDILAHFTQIVSGEFGQTMDVPDKFEEFSQVLEIPIPDPYDTRTEH